LENIARLDSSPCAYKRDSIAGKKLWRVKNWSEWGNPGRGGGGLGRRAPLLGANLKCDGFQLMSRDGRPWAIGPLEIRCSQWENHWIGHYLWPGSRRPKIIADQAYFGRDEGDGGRAIRVFFGVMRPKPEFELKLSFRRKINKKRPCCSSGWGCVRAGGKPRGWRKIRWPSGNGGRFLGPRSEGPGRVITVTEGP